VDELLHYLNIPFIVCEGRLLVSCSGRRRIIMRELPVFNHVLFNVFVLPSVFIFLEHVFLLNASLRFLPYSSGPLPEVSRGFGLFSRACYNFR
jgi:hypothetical protein